MVYEQYLRSLGVNEQAWQQVYNRHNNQLWDQYRQGKASSEDVKLQRFARSFAELGVAQLPASDIAPQFLMNLVQSTVLFPGVVETLTALSGSYTLGVITNGFAASKERLGVLGLDKLFSCLITTEVVGVPKPRPDMFLYALDAVGCLPEEFVYVGDDYDTDIVGAKAAGVQAILFNHKGLDLDAKILQPDAVIYKFTELMDLFPIG